MKKSLLVWQVAGFLFTGVFGVLLHFLFDWTGGNPLVAPFSAVNESIWEHLKLLFFPMLVFAVIESRSVGKEYESFWCVKLIGILSGILLIPVLYYTVQGVFGVSPDWLNITIFFVAALETYLTELWLFHKDKVLCRTPEGAILTLCVLAFLFVVLTYFPPKVPLFQDPLSRTYGYFMN